MADEKKTPGQQEQASPAAPGKPEASAPPVEKPEQSTIEGFAAPAGTDKPKTDPPGKAAPAVATVISVLKSPRRWSILQRRRRLWLAARKENDHLAKSAGWSFSIQYLTCCPHP